MDDLSLDDFEALILWPDGSVEAEEEAAMITTIVFLCKKHGYGRMNQILKGVRDLIRHPERLPEYQKHKERFLGLMEIIEVGKSVHDGD